MKKDFQKWHTKKTWLHEEKQRPFFHEREVWWCALGANVGFEQDGRGESFLRPVVIVKKFNKEVFWGVPLTKNQKKGKFYFAFSLGGEMSTVILSQLRLVDSKRLQYKLGDIKQLEFDDMRKRLTQLLT
ncbi:MAG: type II toxin-antitoxin system PemK/MazF family toxin [bacterium]|nr:type II toxin-antitoxin system PemK/MazF family toxin [bacterium]